MAQTDKQEIKDYIDGLPDSFCRDKLISKILSNFTSKPSTKLQPYHINIIAPIERDNLFSPRWYVDTFGCGKNGYVEYKNTSYLIKEAWLFRGMKDSGWALESTFERKMKSHKDISLYGSEPGLVTAIEKKMLNDFKRYAYDVFNRVPEENELEEWLALMQHHEVSTRLLDWTYSFYVALFFAVEQMEFGDNAPKTCSVWAIKSDEVVQKSFENFDNKSAGNVVKHTLEQYLSDGTDKKAGRYVPIFKVAHDYDINGIFHMSPFYQNKRLRNQQGTFLVPLNLHKTFEETLNALDIDQNKNIKKIDITLNKQQQQHILKTLHSMNINHSTVYPDIKGYGQHINSTTMLEHPYTPIS